MSYAARSAAPEDSGVLASIAPGRPGQAITSWLARLEALLGLPAPTSSEIVEELETHLRERVDDLVRSGTPEAQAVHLAISELGDIADLAVGYRRAHRTSPWRPIMKALLFVAVGSAITLGASALAPGAPAPAGQPSGVRVYAPEQGGWQASEAHAPKPVTVSLADQPFAEVLEAIARTQGMQLHLQRAALETYGIGIEDHTSFEVKNMPLDRALAMLNDSLARSGPESVDVRFADGLMEVAPRSFFDRRESVLAAYDISDLLSVVDAEELSDLLTSIAEPESWMENGGELAAARVVQGTGRLFVTAPPRIQARVSWILEQLEANDEDEAGSRATEREVRSYALSHTPADEISLTVAPLLNMQGVRLTADPSTNSLIVQGSPDQIESLERLIARLDSAVAAENPPSPGR
jgi:hypothetical protein